VGEERSPIYLVHQRFGLISSVAIAFISHRCSLLSRRRNRRQQGQFVLTSSYTPADFGEKQLRGFLSAARGAQGWIPSAEGLPEALRVGFLALISPRPTRGWLRQTWLARHAVRVQRWAFHQWSRYSWAFHLGADIAGPPIGADIAGPSTSGADIAHLLLLERQPPLPLEESSSTGDGSSAAQLSQRTQPLAHLCFWRGSRLCR
jgi:hypothetical protein